MSSPIQERAKKGSDCWRSHLKQLSNNAIFIAILFVRTRIAHFARFGQDAVHADRCKDGIVELRGSGDVIGADTYA